MQIIESFRNIFAIPDLRKRVLFTFGLLAIYRIGSHIPTPGLDASALEEFFKASAGGLLGFLDVFSGGALRRLSVFALGITPYITASPALNMRSRASTLTVDHSLRKMFVNPRFGMRR